MMAACSLACGVLPSSCLGSIQNCSLLPMLAKTHLLTHNLESIRNPNQVDLSGRCTTLRTSEWSGETSCIIWQVRTACMKCLLLRMRLELQLALGAGRPGHQGGPGSPAAAPAVRGAADQRLSAPAAGGGPGHRTGSPLFGRCVHVTGPHSTCCAAGRPSAYCAAPTFAGMSI